MINGWENSTFSGSISKFSVSGIDWLQILWRGDLASNGLNGSVADAQGIVLNFLQSHYELRCERLHVSVPASEILAEAVELHPSVGDDRFFANSKFRRTRFRIALPQCKVTGVDCVILASIFQSKHTDRLSQKAGQNNVQ